MKNHQLARVVSAAMISAAALVVQTATAHAQANRFEPAGRVGQITIDRAFVNNKFDRCRSIFRGPDGDLAFHFKADRTYFISIPTPVGMANATLLTLDLGPRGKHNIPARVNGERLFGQLGNQMVERLLVHSGPVVALVGPTVRYQWAGAKMEDVFIAMENCTIKASGGR